VAVAIMGPDGSGKTTLVNGLSATLPFPTRVLYMGLTGGRLPRADALRVPGLVLAVRLTLLWLRYGVGLYHRARGRVVLFDRYTLDGKVPSGAQLGRLGTLSRRVQALAVPRPELLLVLDASGATMYARKGEYSSAQLEEWRKAYRRLRGRGRVLQVLNAEQPPDVVRRDSQARIWRQYVQRWQHG
jgi:thymidylate kinase